MGSEFDELENTVPTAQCNYQAKVSLAELKTALSKAHCEHCGVTASELMERGEVLEVCGQEYCFDYAMGEQVLEAIALCPDCHAKNHLDAKRQHNPCQIKARLSREGLD